MSEDSYHEVYRQFRTAQDKYVYFLQAAVGGGIVFALNQTHTSALSWFQIPLAFAVCFWAVGFFLGCRYIAYINSSLYSNFELLKIKEGKHPGIGANTDAAESAIAGIRDAIVGNSERQSTLAKWQFRCLAYGALSYTIWHVIEMALRCSH
jgi:hypothetical protein